MTRDFLISFDNEKMASYAEDTLSKIMVDNNFKLFDEIDNRGTDIFVVLTYPKEITNKTFINIAGVQYNLFELVTFVAIKNGEHFSKGYVSYSKNILKYAPPSDSHVSSIHDVVLNFFNIHNNDL